MPAPDLNRVKKSWIEFSDRCLPGVSSVQFTEMRRSYYAGFYSALTEMLKLTKDPDTPEDESVESLQAMHDECETFFQEVKEGTK